MIWTVPLPEQYLDLLSDVAVAAEILSAKTEQVGQIID